MSKKQKTYAEKLKDPRWQKKRLEIMNRDGFQCKLCKDDETELQVHHKEYINGNDPWDYPSSYLVTLCVHCHTEIEAFKKEGAIDGAKIHKSNNWQSGFRIMFTTHENICTMRIYDDNDKFIVGFNFSDRYEMKHIIRMFNKAINNKVLEPAEF